MKRSTPILLSIIALALVVIALNTMGPEAEAQPQVATAPYVVGGSMLDDDGAGLRLTRFWSDGLVETNLGNGGVCNDPTTWCGWVEVRP